MLDGTPGRYDMAARDAPGKFSKLSMQPPKSGICDHNMEGYCVASREWDGVHL